MAPIPEPAREAAHVLLDAVAACQPGQSEEQRSLVVDEALLRLVEVDAVGATFEDEVPHVMVADLVGGAITAMTWLASQLTDATDADRDAVIARARGFIDTQ